MQSRFLIVGQEQLSAYPCVTSDKGVNVRISNTGHTSFTKFAIDLGNNKVYFSGLKPYEVTCYKNVSSLWSNNSYDIYFSKQLGYEQTLMIKAIDHVGETEIKEGNVTIEVAIKKHKKQLVAEIRCVSDKK
jgi:hypothetical protein